MKKYKLLLLITILMFKFSFGQIFNQDAQGKSSIVGLGGTINVDIKESLFKANYYKSSLAPKAVVLGVDVQGKNNEGLVGIWENGNFSPAAEASVLIGGKYAWQDPGIRTYRLLYYLRLGLKGSEFKYDRGDNFTTVGTRFRDTSHVTPTIEAGATFRWGGRLTLGLLVGNSRENNQGSLNKSVYKYVNNSTSLPGLQQTKDVTAYSGNYGTYSNTRINFDALYFHSVDSIYIIPAVYFRYNFSSDEDLQENNGVLGVSLNFVNMNSGAFFGGVYVQNNDIFNDASQGSSLFKQIQFGFVARFSFTTIRPN